MDPTIQAVYNVLEYIVDNNYNLEDAARIIYDCLGMDDLEIQDDFNQIVTALLESK